MQLNFVPDGTHDCVHRRFDASECPVATVHRVSRKTKAQGVCSEPRSPTKSPWALGSSKEHSMRMGGILSAPLTNTLALGGGRSALNYAPRHYH